MPKSVRKSLSKTFLLWPFFLQKNWFWSSFSVECVSHRFFSGTRLSVEFPSQLQYTYKGPLLMYKIWQSWSGGKYFNIFHPIVSFFLNCFSMERVSQGSVFLSFFSVERVTQWRSFLNYSIDTKTLHIWTKFGNLVSSLTYMHEHDYARMCGSYRNVQSMPPTRTHTDAQSVAMLTRVTVCGGVSYARARPDYGVEQGG